MKNLSYISELCLPSNSGYAQHVLKICDSFSKKFETKLQNHLKCFDGWYGTENENLKSEIKLNTINRIACVLSLDQATPLYVASYLAKVCV